MTAQISAARLVDMTFEQAEKTPMPRDQWEAYKALHVHTAYETPVTTLEVARYVEVMQEELVRQGRPITNRIPWVFRNLLDARDIVARAAADA